MKRRIRLTEGDLRRIVNRSVRRALNEDIDWGHLKQTGCDAADNEFEGRRELFREIAELLEQAPEAILRRVRNLLSKTRRQRNGGIRGGGSMA